MDPEDPLRLDRRSAPAIHSIGMRIALAQLNSIVGDVRGNTSRVREAIAAAGARGADLVVFPEMVVTGYPPGDLLERPTLAEQSEKAVQDLAATTASGPAALVGYAGRNPAERSKPFHNVAALLAQGEVRTRYVKRLLPSYDVFDEDRWFGPGDQPGIVEIGGRRLGIAVCEDIWNHSTFIERPLYADDPLEDLAGAGVRVILNPSASPFVLGKPQFRERMLADVARNLGASVLFVNQVGGNDELVFDGGSLAVDPGGRTCARGPLFEESLLVVELDEGGAMAGEDAGWPAEKEAILSGAIQLGVRDYVRKCGFGDVILGLSGGIDSSLVASLATDALGSGHVTGLAMPSRFSSEGSLADARALAANLGIRLVEIPIEPVYEALLGVLEPHFGKRPFDMTEENLQARVRSTLLMAYSNKLGGLVLAPGNKSEIAVGYCTLYGDMVGALAPIGDLLKTDVCALARHVNRDAEIIPEAILEKAPSAELRPDQTDQDSLPPYDELDHVLRRYLEEESGAESIESEGVSPETVRRVLEMVRRAEHKRSQAPLVLKLSARAFGPGRRYPIAQGFED